MSDIKEPKYKKKPDHFLNKYSLFTPRSRRSLILDYPELGKYKELLDLSKIDLLFVWYYACEASPYSSTQTDQDRAIKASAVTYRRNKQISEDKILAIEDLNFDDKLAMAIEKMESFRMGPRVRMRKMVDNMLSNYEKIINVDISGEEFQNEDGEKDLDKIKDYSAISKLVLASMNDILSKSEDHFGTTDNGVDDDIENLAIGNTSVLDYFHEQKD